ncbi:MAG: 5'-methylthioadenosine/adenosylhomocysteine nucleosidase [Eubacteriales bacterium]
MMGIIGAMSVEIEKIQKEIENPIEREISGITYISGTIYEKEVVVAICGVGKVFAGICTQVMILAYEPDVVISIGVAGTLTRELSVTDIAVADKMVQHDMDTSPVGDPLGMISGINMIYLPCDKKVVSDLQACLATLSMKGLTGTMASGDQFVVKQETRDFIVQEFGAIACEMEGAAIAQVCYVNEVPCGVLRSISDSADDGAQMDYPSFMKLAAERSFTLIQEYIRQYER